jgi:dipeptidyl aminopeptidase/acylaminoacyl peptidase
MSEVRGRNDTVRAAHDNGRARRTSRDGLTIEQAAAVESPREFRLSPDGRRFAFTAEGAGARQIYVMALRGGYPEQLTATEKAASDPQWSPDGRRIAFVRDESIWMIDVEGSHQALVTAHPAGNRAPRWSPGGHHIAFISRRRGWDQLWLVDAPVPRRGRPASKPRNAEATPLTAAGVDVVSFVWSPDGKRIAVSSQRLPDLLTSQIHVITVSSGAERLVAGHTAWETGPRWLPDGSGLLMISDEDGWFQVLRISADGAERTRLTSDRREHGEPGGGWGYVPLPSPDGKRFVHVEMRDGQVDLVVSDLPASHLGPGEGGGGGASEAAGSARRSGAGTDHRSAVVNPFDGVWMAVDWLPDSSAVVAVGESERAPEDLWLLPVPEAAAQGLKPRQLTHSMPVVIDTARFSGGKRISFEARDGRRIEGTLYLPMRAAGAGTTGAAGSAGAPEEEATHFPCVVHSHGGPTHQALREWLPFRQLVVEMGAAWLSVDFRGSTGYGREFRWANRGEWGHADAFDVIDAARWAAAQPWCDGRLAHYGASYGGYMTLCVLTEEPSLWRAGIDLYGDSEIAESYRHGDRAGRIDLERMMGRPDDAESEPAFRRGSPLYRAERIEAPLLIMHGRKDKRVVPLMTEKLVEALEIEGKHYQVHWYDDEEHGWHKRDNRRDAWKRCLDFLKRHLLDQTEEE